MSEKEHKTSCETDHCPVCDETADGYDELWFEGDSVNVRYRCGKCGTMFVEEYAYNATYHYTYGEERS